MKKNNTEITKVDTAGQITAVVTSVVSEKIMSLFARDIMDCDPTIEQVGFVKKTAEEWKLEMMGGELSINGSLAAGFVLSQMIGTEAVTFVTSGLNKSIATRIETTEIVAQFPKDIVEKVTRKNVFLGGIRYQLSPGLKSEKLLNTDEFALLKKLCDKCPAAGIIFYEDNQIQPVIYVAKTETLIWENACGSGSLAFALTTKQENIRQPSGAFISIIPKGDRLLVRAPVRKV